MDACAAHVRRIAPLDHVLYMRYASAFRAQLAKLGEPFAARVRAFKAAGARPWVGGADPGATTNAQCSWQSDNTPETYEYENNPCMTVPPELGWLADRCMGVTNKNAEACCVRFKPTPPSAEHVTPVGDRDGEWHQVWTRQVCKMRGGKCTAAASRLAKDEPAWTRAVRLRRRQLATAATAKSAARNDGRPSPAPSTSSSSECCI